MSTTKADCICSARFNDQELCGAMSEYTFPESSIIGSRYVIFSSGVKSPS